MDSSNRVDSIRGGRCLVGDADGEAPMIEGLVILVIVAVMVILLGAALGGDAMRR